MINKIISYIRLRKSRKAISELISNINHILHVNDDILSDAAKRKANELLDEARAIDPADFAKAEDFIEKAPLRAAKIFPKNNYPVFREYADILAVAFSVAFGIRALYLQPFKIPTSSMQPTLFGIHYVKDSVLPKIHPFLSYCIYSARKAELTVKKEGYLDMSSFQPYNSYLILPRTRFKIGGINYDLPGDKLQILRYCFNVKDENDYMRLFTKKFEEGEKFCDGYLVLGDHLFVDRYTFHFREPRRGDVCVFVTEGLPCRERGYFYIKRLIGMPGDTIKNKDGVVHVKEKGAEKFVPITAFGIKEINRIYSGKGGYHGHTPMWSLANENEIEIPENSYFMMGDNSSNSSDSRDWGFVPRRNIIGRAFFIFWPFSRRWGLTDKNPPLDMQTTPELLEMEYQ